MAKRRAAGGSREAAVCDESDLLVQALAGERGGHGKHFAHAGTSLGAFVADHDNVAGLYFSRLDGLHRVAFVVKDARGACVLHQLLGAGASLYDRSAGSQVSKENRDSAVVGIRVFYRTQNFRVAVFDALDVLRDCLSRRGDEACLD